MIIMMVGQYDGAGSTSFVNKIRLVLGDSWIFERESLFWWGTHCAKMALLTKFRACISGCDFHKVYALVVSEQVLFNS